MSTTMRGCDMPQALQREALACFVHRYTRSHKPQWASHPMPSGKAYPVQFASDADWLANTTFQVTLAGKLHRNADCHSSPTWPDNPELRRELANA
jgi:hypothetical protein